MITLTLLSGTKTAINPEMITHMESSMDGERQITYISFNDGFCRVQEDFLTVMNMIVQHHFYGDGGESNG